jgi:hypothetical protein
VAQGQTIFELDSCILGWTAQIILTCAPKIYYISDANVNPMTTTSKLAGQQLVNQIYSCQVYNYDFFLMNIFDRFLT